MRLVFGGMATQVLGLVARWRLANLTGAWQMQVCTRAGFTVTAVAPLPPPATFSIIEATPA